MIALTNVLVFCTALYSEWRLFEVSLVYLGELVIIMLFVYAKVIAASKLPMKFGTHASPAWRLRGQKVLAVLVSFPMYAVLVGVLALVAVVDSALHLVELDAAETAPVAPDNIE